MGKAQTSKVLFGFQGFLTRFCAIPEKKNAYSQNLRMNQVISRNIPFFITTPKRKFGAKL